MAKSYKVSDHYDGKTFFNPVPVETKSFWSVLKWQITADRVPWPEWVENEAKPQLGAARSDKEVNLTFINHASFLLQFQKANVIVDPQYSERTSPVSFAGPKRVRKPGVEFDDLPDIHVVLVTHNHYDHLDLDTLERLYKKFKPHFVVPLGDKKILQTRGIENISELDWWETVPFADGDIVLTPAQHWSARGLFDRFESLWGGFYIRTKGIKIFWAGDTGYGPHFKQISEKLGAPDISFMPIGAYEPRWFMKDMHMNPEEAVFAHKDMNSKMSVGIHFGTFQLTDEGIDDPIKALEEAKTKHQVKDFIIFKEGQSQRCQPLF